jgi:hypothetical protein
MCQECTVLVIRKAQGTAATSAVLGAGSNPPAVRQACSRPAPPLRVRLRAPTGMPPPTGAGAPRRAAHLRAAKSRVRPGCPNSAAMKQLLYAWMFHSRVCRSGDLPQRALPSDQQMTSQGLAAYPLR